MIRLKEVVYSLEDIKKKVLNLGYCGDKGVLEIKFDCSEFFKDKETKNAKLLLIKPDDTNSAIDLTVTDDMASLSVDDGITDVVGFGEYQLKLGDGTNVFHSAKGRYCVGKVIDDPTPVGLTGRTFMFNEFVNLDFGIGDYSDYDIVNPVDIHDPTAGFNVIFTDPITGTAKFVGIVLVPEQGIILYMRETQKIQNVYNDKTGWSNNDYRTIKFVSEATGGQGFENTYMLSTEETLAWLAENATEITE